MAEFEIEPSEEFLYWAADQAAEYKAKAEAMEIMQQRQEAESRGHSSNPAPFISPDQEDM